MSYTYDTWWSPNTNGGGYAKEGVCIHHAATTDFDGIGRTFQDTARQTSAHYGVEPGHVCQYLEDDCNAWACSNAWANNSLISIECVNSGGEAEGWPVAEETIDTLVEWLADKSREHGFGHYVVGENLFGHKDFYATFCPGVLYDRLGEIAERANALLDSGAESEDDVSADDIWNFNQNGTLMRDRIQGTDEAANGALREAAGANAAAGDAREQLTRTDDVSGRDTKANMYERICWLGKRTEEQGTQLAAIDDRLDALTQKLDTVLGKL